MPQLAKRLTDWLQISGETEWDHVPLVDNKNNVNIHVQVPSYYNSIALTDSL